MPSELAYFRILPTCNMVQIMVLIRRSDFLEFPILPSELALFRYFAHLQNGTDSCIKTQICFFGSPDNALRTGYFP